MSDWRVERMAAYEAEVRKRHERPTEAALRAQYNTPMDAYRAGQRDVSNVAADVEFITLDIPKRNDGWYVLLYGLMILASLAAVVGML